MRQSPDWAPFDTLGDDGVFMANALAYFAKEDVAFVGFWDSNSAYQGGKFSDGSHPNIALAFLQAEGSSYLQAYLKGATVYTGPLKATAPGVNSFMVQLADGSMALVFWGNTTTKTALTITLSAARAVGAFHPTDGSKASWGRESSVAYAYTSGLSVLTISVS